VTRALVSAASDLRGIPRAAAPTSGAALPEPPAPRTIEQEKSLASANETLETAIRRGRLTRDDVQALRSALEVGAATTAESDEIRRTIAQAVNDKRLVPEDPRFLLP
jgi:hypothetical protein